MRQGRTKWNKEQTADEIGSRLNQVEDTVKVEDINEFNRVRYGYPEGVELPENITVREVEGFNDKDTAWMRRVNAIPSQPTLKFSEEAVEMRKKELEEKEAKEERRQKYLGKTWNAFTGQLLNDFK